ncbi:hypothetical protein ACQPYH_05395 [Kribbella sp. CA-245084]|uniref:hypothetical protein n=1 Tax=Kribbella sp. CA-245084 TaxID=3239940 RepID=UPI003D93A7A7
METSEVLKKAWAAVKEADLPEKIHEVAFREAVRLETPVQQGMGQGPAGSGKPAGGSGGPGGSGRTGGSGSGGGPKSSEGDITLSEGELLSKVVEHTGADLGMLENLVHLDEGNLRVSLPGLKLGKSNADRARTIAHLFTIIRGFGLDEDGTSVELVRNEAQRLKCYDSANFSSQLNSLAGFVITGSGSNRRIRAKTGGIQEFPNLVIKLSGE